MSPPLILLLVVVVVAVILIVVALTSRKPSDSLQARLAEYSMRETPATLEEIELSMPFSERVIMPLVQRASTFAVRFTPAQTLESTRHKLDLAGNPNNWTASQFFGIRVIAAIGGPEQQAEDAASRSAVEFVQAMFPYLGRYLPE